jgi:hypothetical protein
MYPRICIPSYNRPELLRSKTLAFLQREFYPRERINIFVASEDERIRYQAVGDYNIVVGVLGLKPQRRFISDWLDDNEIYIGMDDDIDGIKSNKSFLELITDACQFLNTRRSGLWGVLPKDDARCFKDDTTEHLSFIIGCFFVCRNHKEILLEGLCETDDYERTILYFLRYGCVYRYRGAGIKTKYLGTSGGQGSAQHSLERKHQAVQFLLETYPDLCRFRDKNGEPDILLNWRYNPV